MNLHGSTILSETRAFLAETYAGLHGEPPKYGFEVNGVRVVPETAEEAVDLHAGDVPNGYRTFDEAFAAFAFVLPTLSQSASAFPAYLRRAVAIEIVSMVAGGLRGVDAHLSAHATAKEAQDPRTDRRGLSYLRGRVEALPEVMARNDYVVEMGEAPLTVGPAWANWTAGLREGVAWFAELAFEATDFRSAVRARIGSPEVGAVDAGRTRAFALSVADRGIAWFGHDASLNFLRESGMPEFARPDAHALAILAALDPRVDARARPECPAAATAAYEALVRIANEAGVWPRTIDRLLSLVGSANFQHQVNRPLPEGEARVAELLKRLPRPRALRAA